jgi:hypothetical protein
MATIKKISTNCSQKLRMRSVNALQTANVGSMEASEVAH